ncbi:MAG: hypothetical protein Hens3KO_04930 [Henriciella sp.]
MRGLYLVITFVLLWLPARAAPWVQPEGDLYARVAIATEEVEGLHARRADIYGEYGLTENWTLSAKSEAVAYEDAEDFNAQGWRATARRRLFTYKGFVTAIEVGALQGAAIGGANGCETLGAEARIGAAWSGTWRKRETFAFSELVGREHDGCQRQRFEFGLGQRVTKNIWTISQVWIERGSQNAESDKLQSELLWRQESWDFSLGYRQENGRQFDETGVFFAVARRY